jgi:hypothetical protein
MRMEHKAQAFTLEEFLKDDPFHLIYVKRRDEESDFFYVHTDYLDYLRYLNIIWDRIRKEYQSIVRYHQRSLSLISNRDLSQEENIQLRSIILNRSNLLTILECDIESFVLFARRFLDKVGKLVEYLIKLEVGRHIENSFTKHREFFIDNEKYNLQYSRLLREETNWYLQDLSMWRDGIFVHGKTLNTGSSVSATGDIILRKAIGVYRLQEKDRIKFMKISKKYIEKYPHIKITKNPYTMIDEFREEIAKHSIQIDPKDLNSLKEIISVTGTSLDIRQLAKNIKVFVEKTTQLFEKG